MGVPQGPTTVINAPPGSPGETVKVPPSAKVGQAMLVPAPVEAAVTCDGKPLSTGGTGAAGVGAAAGVRAVPFDEGVVDEGHEIGELVAAGEFVVDEADGDGDCVMDLF